MNGDGLATRQQALLTVKELAWALGRKPHYVYHMRMVGFSRGKRMATLPEARRWLELTGFTIRDGRPVTR